MSTSSSSLSSIVPAGWSLSTRSGAIWEMGRVQRGSSEFTSRKSVKIKSLTYNWIDNRKNAGRKRGATECFLETNTIHLEQRFYSFQCDFCTIVKIGEEVLEQNPATLLPVLEAVESPLLQQSLTAAVHVCVQQARKPLLQQGVDVIHHLTQQHPAWWEKSSQWWSTLLTWSLPATVATC